jgi:hypothetical protein
MSLHVFVGYDTREHAAWLVCRDSIAAFAEDVVIHPLSHRDLRRRGYFDRPWRIEETGQMVDERDGLPFSTEFSHTRFLVPHLAREAGVKDGPVLFVDCDFMFRRPLRQMLDRVDRTKVLSVIKHDVTIPEGTKMDGQEQHRYRRKLWSSLMIWNMAHPDIDRFCDPAPVNTASGRDLHQFQGLAYSQIGDIPVEWNWIPGLSPHRADPAAVHWSLGGPWMPEYASEPYAHEWRRRYRDVVSTALDKNLSDTFALV